MLACAKPGFVQTALREPESWILFLQFLHLAKAGCCGCMTSLCKVNKCHLTASVISKIYLCVWVFACM